VQAILTETAQEVALWAREQGAAADEVLLGELTEAGMQVNVADRDSFVEAAKPVYEKFSTEVDNGQAMIDQVMELASGS